MSERASGTVKWFNEKRVDSQSKTDPKSNYGFIVAEDGNEVFVHGNDVADDSYPLHDKDKVSFEVITGKKGSKAVNVSRVV